MELSGSSYLLTLAQLALAFVGFATIVVALRQAIGADLSDYHILLFRFFVEVGLIVTALCLIPFLLALFDIAEPTVWRISSAFFGVVTVAYLVSYVRRRRRVQRAPLPVRLYVIYGVSALMTMGLILNALGLLFEPGAGPYAVALTWGLVGAGLVFIQGLSAFLQRTPSGKA
jgi:hypothetical protein